MKKVLFIQHDASIGGAPISLMDILEHINLQKIVPHVIFSAYGPMVSIFQDAGYTVSVESKIGNIIHCNTGLSYFRMLFELIKGILKAPYQIAACEKILRREQPVLVYLNSSPLVFWGIAAKKMGIPVIWHIREHISDGMLGIRRLILTKIFHSCSTHIITLSKTYAKQLGNSRYLTIVPNYVKLDRFKLTQKSNYFEKKYGSEFKNYFKILILSWGSRVKGADILVEAAKYIKYESNQIKIILVGKGYFQLNSNKLKEKIRHFFGVKLFAEKLLDSIKINKLEQVVYFHDACSNVPELLHDADLVVFPATESHFGRSIIEAYAAKVPVIGSDVDNNQELIENGKTGLLFRNRDARDLAEKIIQIYKNQELREQLIKAGYALVNKRFEAHKNSKKVNQIISKVLSEN